jgi:hypothetical protein
MEERALKFEEQQDTLKEVEAAMSQETKLKEQIQTLAGMEDLAQYNK